MNIKLNKNFYNLKAINNVIDIFEKNKIGFFSVKENETNYQVIGKNINKEFLNIVKEEFFNFLIAEIKKNNGI